jgi:hypothetical protein
MNSNINVSNYPSLMFDKFRIFLYIFFSEFTVIFNLHICGNKMNFRIILQHCLQCYLLGRCGCCSNSPQSIGIYACPLRLH